MATVIASLLTCCESTELPVTDYSFTAKYSPADTISRTQEQLQFILSIEDYTATEDITLQYRVNNLHSDTLTINGTRTAEPYTFSPAIDKLLHIGFIPQDKGKNSISITLSNSQYSTQADITVQAMEETTYSYDWKNYEFEITTVEGI